MNLDFSSFISACAGGLAGAAAAVYFQYEKEKHDRHNTNHSALLKVQIQLTHQLDGVWNIDNQFLKEHRDKEDRFIRVPYIVHPYSPSSLDIDSLVFLTEEDDDPEIIFHIQKAYESFNVLIEMVRQRNQKIEELYSRRDTASDNLPMDSQILRRNVTRDEYIVLKGHMDSVYTALDYAENKIKDSSKRLHSKISRLFPGLKNFRYERKE